MSQKTPRSSRAVLYPDDRIKAILVDAEVDGQLLRIPAHLDRADYVAVDKTLQALGGKWNRRRRAHVFDFDPRQAVARVLEGDGVPASARSREGFVETPAALARQIVSTYSGLSSDTSARVLEPSAGSGALVKVILDHAPSTRVVAIEPNQGRAHTIPAHPSVTVHVETFEQYAETSPAQFDSIIMNPPYSTSENPTLWIDHFHLASRLLAPGGRMVAILPSGMTFRQDRRHREVRDLLESFGAYSELAADAFTSSGTSVRTVVAWMSRPTLRR